MKMFSRTVPPLFKGVVKVASGAASIPIPGLDGLGELLGIVIELCERVPQNRNAARQLANSCQNVYKLLEQYEKVDLPDRLHEYRQAVFDCLTHVKSKMEDWSGKTWFYMLGHHEVFENDINACNESICQCFNILTAATNLETLANQKRDSMWKDELMESIRSDREEFRKSLTSSFLIQKAVNDNVAENRTDVRRLADVMQKRFSGLEISKDERDQMARNLYDLLRLSHQLLPQLQLDSGEVEWENRSPVHGWKDVNIYKGRYLQREDVMIKAIRSVKNDEKNVTRIRREVELWAKIYETDKGKHVLPFYGFCTSDGVHLALVSPWVENGNALQYVKQHDKAVDYKKLIRGIAKGVAVLHSMEEPVIHGLLKAEKILIGDEGQPLLTDFALAKLEGNALTMTAGSSDAYRWYAPEICGETSLASTKSDIYSFGMTMLELFTHQRPYYYISRSTAVIRKMERGIPPEQPTEPEVIERGLDDNMWGLLLACWAFEPEQRPSIGELMTLLKRI